jgi:mannosyltransferase OCH1-like enzyme
MAIPKTIFQTFHSKKLPFITRQFIKLMNLRNPAYDYEFYDDERIEMFMLKEFDDTFYQAYKKLNTETYPKICCLYFNPKKDL